MSAIERAVARGNAARKQRGSRFEAVGVDNPGWITARLREKNGEEFGLFYAQGTWQHAGIHRRGNGEVTTYNVREAEAKRMAKAMIEPRDPEERDELMREVAAIRQARTEAKVAEMESK